MIRKRVKIVDNFLPNNAFIKIKDLIEGGYFTWYWSSHSTGTDYIPQLVHGFMEGSKVSGYFELWEKSGLFKKLGAYSVASFKVNCNYKTHEQYVGVFHTDFVKEENKGLNTSILYINTNNGGTKFEDGTFVNSVANRLVTFDCSTRHAAVSCTDENRRIVLNINYTIGN